MPVSEHFGRGKAAIETTLDTLSRTWSHLGPAFIALALVPPGEIRAVSEPSLLSPDKLNNCLDLVSANYAEETNTYPFASSFVAANVSSGGTEGLSDGTIIELMKFDMQVIYPTTVAFVRDSSDFTHTYLILSSVVPVFDFSVPLPAPIICQWKGNRFPSCPLFQRIPRSVVQQ